MKLLELRVAEFCSFFEHHWEHVSELECFVLLDAMLTDADGKTDALELAEHVAHRGVKEGKRQFIAVVLRWLLMHANQLTEVRVTVPHHEEF